MSHEEELLGSLWVAIIIIITTMVISSSCLTAAIFVERSSSGSCNGGCAGYIRWRLALLSCAQCLKRAKLDLEP